MDEASEMYSVSGLRGELKSPEIPEPIGQLNSSDCLDTRWKTCVLHGFVLGLTQRSRALCLHRISMNGIHACAENVKQGRTQLDRVFYPNPLALVSHSLRPSLDT